MAEETMIDFLADPQDQNFCASKALVRHLRSEADLSEQKAKRLRDQIKALVTQFGVSDFAQEQYEIDPTQLAPLDENGVPKYKGKKRGRKPKVRKRKANPNRRKRQHTAYTLFVKSTYPGIKAANPGLASKDVISIVAGQWKNGLSVEEKQEWKIRALATRDTDDQEQANAAIESNSAVPSHEVATVVVDEHVDEAEHDGGEEEDDDIDNHDDENDEEEDEEEEEEELVRPQDQGQQQEQDHEDDEDHVLEDDDDPQELELDEDPASPARRSSGKRAKKS